jgi:hypothetical protein
MDPQFPTLPSGANPSDEDLKLLLGDHQSGIKHYTSPILHLPTEIMQQILTDVVYAGVDMMDRPIHHSRTAAGLSLVCKYFNRLAQPLLYSTLELHAREPLSKLLQTLSSNPSLAGHCRTLNLYYHPTTDDDPAAWMVAFCPQTSNIRTLRVHYSALANERNSGNRWISFISNFRSFSNIKILDVSDMLEGPFGYPTDHTAVFLEAIESLPCLETLILSDLKEIRRGIRVELPEVFPTRDQSRSQRNMRG